MLGADGVLVGTRFYATREAAGAPAAKERIVAADGDGTVRGILFDIARRNVWPAPFTGRVLRNAFAERWRGRERSCCSARTRRRPSTPRRARRATSTPPP